MGTMPSPKLAIRENAPGVRSRSFSFAQVTHASATVTVMLFLLFVFVSVMERPQLGEICEAGPYRVSSAGVAVSGQVVAMMILILTRNE